MKLSAEGAETFSLGANDHVLRDCAVEGVFAQSWLLML
jgi:hypothetical protein